MEEMGVIDCVVTPISIPMKRNLLPLHVKKHAFLCHVATEMPVAFDEDGVLEFVKPLFEMQAMGSRNNVLIAFSEDRLAMVDALVAWQLYGGIALPIVGNVQSALTVLNQMLSVPLNGIDGGKRAISFTTNLPYPELDICDDWTMEQVLVYSLVNGNLPHTKEKRELFTMSQLDRNVLLEGAK